MKAKRRKSMTLAGFTAESALSASGRGLPVQPRMNASTAAEWWVQWRVCMYIAYKLSLLQLPGSMAYGAYVAAAVIDYVLLYPN
jgi:hypothetical protein